MRFLEQLLDNRFSDPEFIEQQRVSINQSLEQLHQNQLDQQEAESSFSPEELSKKLDEQFVKCEVLLEKLWAEKLKPIIHQERLEDWLGRPVYMYLDVHGYLYDIRVFCQKILGIDQLNFTPKTLKQRRFSKLSDIEYHRLAKIYHKTAELCFMQSIATCFAEKEHIQLYKMFINFCKINADKHGFLSQQHVLAGKEPLDPIQLHSCKLQIAQKEQDSSRLENLLEKTRYEKKPEDLIENNLPLSKPTYNWVNLPLRRRGHIIT